MKLDISKVERQQAGAHAWRNKKGIGTLEWVQRFGKTYGAIMFIINPHLEKGENNSIHVIVPSEIIAKQWRDNLLSFGEYNSRVKISTASYISSNKITDEVTLLVVDELQKFTTPDRKAMIDGTLIKHTYRLGLTGTYPRDVDWIQELYPIVDTITEEEAIANNWVSNFIEYNILLQMSDKDKFRYQQHSAPITETLELFKGKSWLLMRGEKERLVEGDYELIDACYRGFKTIDLYGVSTYVTYDKICNALAYKLGWHTQLDITIPENAELHKTWSPNAIHVRAKNFNNSIRARNEILINSTIKLHLVGEIVAKNQVSTICFNESTAFADAICDYVNARFGPNYRAACYHSKIDSRTMINPETGDYYKFTTGDRKGLPKILGKDAIKKIVIDGTKNGVYHFISTAKALDEGVDIPIIEQVICTGGTTNPLTYAQRIARGKTIDVYNPNKITKIFNLVFDDFITADGEVIKSRDKTKLAMRQKLSGNTVHWLHSLDEINMQNNV